MRRKAPALLWALLAVSACSGPGDEPVYEIRQRPFIHRVTADGTLRSVKRTKISVPAVVRSRVRLTWIAADGAVVVEGDVIARFDHKDFERRLEAAQADLETAGLGLAESRAESDRKLAEYRRDFEVADLELDFAQSYQKEDEDIFSRFEIAESEIDEDLAGVRRDHAERMSSTQSGLGRTELDLLGIEQRKATMRIDEARAGLESLEVRAPQSGILTLSRNWRGESPTIGAEMWAGQEIGEIPVLDEVEAEVFVLEADAAGLVEGELAVVVVEAHPEVSNRGRVVRVDALAKPRFRGSPVQYFGVTVSLDATDRETMKPGQRVSATLILEEMESALVVPRQALFSEGARTWVYRRNGSGFEVRQVETGPASVGLVVVTGGLEEGDVIALIRPRGASSAEAESS